MSSYAQIANDTIIVVNTIIADPDFEIDGFYLIDIQGGILCQKEMYLNKANGLFYDDESFITIMGVKPS